MNIFVDDSDTDVEPNSKRQKIEESGSQISEDSEEADLSSDSDIDWEDIPLDPIRNASPDSFNITIHDGRNVARSDRKDRERLKKITARKTRKLALHNMSLLCYIVHGYLRNKLLSHPKVLKTLKKLLPDSIITRVKKLNKDIKRNQSDTDVQLIYILKYLIKWFRLNFKITSNGLRILGYLPENILDAKDKGSYDNYFIQNSPQFSNLKEFISIIKSFNHNRDMAAQLFTGLLRSLGFNCRLVFSLPVLSSKNKDLQPKVDREKFSRNKDFDLLYPYFWTELVNPINDSELIILETCTFHEEEKRIERINRYQKSLNNYCSYFYPIKDQFNNMSMSYVISIDSDNYILDVSSRYMKNICYRWFDRLDLRTEAGRSFLLFQSLLRILNQQKLNGALELEALRFIGLNNYDIPNTNSSIKRSPNFTTHSTIRYDEVISESTEPASKVTIDGKRISIYFKNSVIFGKSEQKWKFLGRSIIPDQRDKYIKTTKTLAPRSRSQKLITRTESNPDEVKLYAFYQTCPYIKEKLDYISGVPTLPRNRFGNIEIFRESMVPDGCTWLKLSNIDTALRFPASNIQFVPVVSGFRFKKYGIASPLKMGIIVLNEQVIEAKKIWLKFKINQYKEEQRDKKLRALQGWSNFLKRLNIKSRIEKAYPEKKI